MKKEIVKSKWHPVIKIIIILFILSFIASWIISLFIDTDFMEGNVALIPIKGVIISEDYDIFGQEVADSQTIVDFIEQADENPKIQAIIFEINSPGGAPVATEEISNAIEKTNKTTIAWIREIGTSAGYWVASSCDQIVASKMSTTGSIGAVISFLEFSGLIEDYNITYQRFVSGKYKDIGTPFRQPSINEKKQLQEYIDTLHSYFVSAVAKNRNIPEEKVKEMATGMFYLGAEAKDLGLVDVLGGKDEVIDIIEEKHNITAQIVTYEKEIALGDILSGIFSTQSFSIGEGIGSSLLKSRNKIEVWT